MRTAAKEAKRKAEHPERFCPVSGCLWRTNGWYCPQHSPRTAEEQAITFLENHATVLRLTSEMAGAMIVNAMIDHLKTTARLDKKYGVQQ